MPVLDPCGRACDWMRSAYEVDMLFDPTGTGHRIRWYRADPSQPWAPDGNQFVSTNWINRDRTAGELGEQPGTMPWKNGKDFRNYPVQTGDPCSIDTLLTTGFTTPGEEVGPWTDGKLDCCSGPFDCTTLPSTLHVQIDDLSGCGGIVGSFDITSVASCVWQGGTPLFTLGYSMGAWFRFLNCTGGDPTWTQVSFTTGPLNLVFDVLDTTGGMTPALCCGVSGLDTFRVTITE
jgi:hypothetical protein